MKIPILIGSGTCAIAGLTNKQGRKMDTNNSNERDRDIVLIFFILFPPITVLDQYTEIWNIDCSMSILYGRLPAIYLLRKLEPCGKRLYMDQVDGRIPTFVGVLYARNTAKT